jgi:hypothetical protein
MSEDELRRQLVEAVRRSATPQFASRLHDALARPRPSEERVKGSLAELVQQGVLFLRRVGRYNAYARDAPPSDEELIRGALAGGPLSRAQICEALKASGVPERRCRAAIERMAAAKRLYRHPKAGNVPERVGLEPPDPGVYIARPIAEIQEHRRMLVDLGVTDEAWKAALVAALGLSSLPAAATNGKSDEESLLTALRDLTAEEGEEALLSVGRVRAMRDLDKRRFDQALLRLQSAGKVTLHSHDFPQSLPSEERNALVVDDRGVYYAGVALRRMG